MVIPPDGATVDNYTLVYCPGQMINGISEEKDCKVSKRWLKSVVSYLGNVFSDPVATRHIAHACTHTHTHKHTYMYCI